MATLDSSIVNIALPTLTKELGVDLTHIKWVVISYLLVITCLLLPFGRISDQYGRRKVFRAGFVIFTIGSILCGLSPTLVTLLASRVVQGIGASMLMSNGPAIITANVPASERGKALGVLAMVVSAGLISGPSIGGVLITYFGWRSIFLANIPIGIVGIWLAGRHIKRDVLPAIHPRFDWRGSILQMLILFAMIVCVEPPSLGIALKMSRIPWMIALVVMCALFLKVESRAAAPILDFSLLKNRTFWSGNLASLLSFISFSSVTVMMPFFLEEVMQFAPGRAGLFMTAVPLTIFFVAPISGRLSDKLGSRGLSVVGALVGSIGLFVMAGAFGMGIHAEASSSAIVLALCSMGLANGIFQSPNNNAIMGAVPQSKLGVASALLATIRNLGLVTGTGLATALFSWRLRVSNDFVASLHIVFFVAAVISLGAMGASLAKERRA